MANWSNKACCGNPRTAALIVGSFSTAQFFVELLAMLCFAIYIVPFNTAIKVFYSFAAVFAALMLFTSLTFIKSVAKDNCNWMRPWLVMYLVVAVSEIVITLVALVNIYAVKDIMQFYTSAWNLAQSHLNDQLFVAPANSTSCRPVSNAFLLTNSDAVRDFALICQQGQGGVVAFVATLLVAKNIFNVFSLIVGIVQYKELQNGRGFRRRYAASNVSDPHARQIQRRRQFSAVRTVAS